MTELSKLKLETSQKTKNWDDVFRLMSWWDSEKVASATVMVAGAGALGNEVLKNLALLNIGNILIVDFDTIEYANLSRSVLFREEDANSHRQKAQVASERIKDINPNVMTMVINGDIGIDVGLGVFRRVDVVIGCLDNRLARLFINRNCFRVNKVWVDGAIENLAGQLNVYKPDISCYECQLTDSEWNDIRVKLGCADIARRNKSGGRIPTTPISASIIGAIQVQEALKIIYNNEKQSLAGQTFQYEGMNNMILIHQASTLKQECDSHYPLEEIIEAKELSHKSTVREVLDWCRAHFRSDTISISLDHEVVVEITSEKTGKTHQVMKAKPHLSDRFLEQFCEDPGENFLITKSVAYIDLDFEEHWRLMDEFGIPPLHILTVETAQDIFFLELSGDQNYLRFR